MKGDISIDYMIGIVISIATAAIIMALLWPSIISSEQYASCDAVMRPIAAIIYNWAGINIC